MNEKKRNEISWKMIKYVIGKRIHDLKSDLEDIAKNADISVKELNELYNTALKEVVSELE